MSKVEAKLALKIFSDICIDITEILELEDGALDTCLEQVSRSTLSRGFEEVFLLSLPEICNDFDRSLEIGWYNRRFKGTLSSGTPYPNFLSILFSRVFSEDGVIFRDPCHQSIRCIRQVLRLFKKLDIDCPTRAKEKAIESFVLIEHETILPQLSWGDRSLRVTGKYPCLVDLVQLSLERDDTHTRLSEATPQWRRDRLLRIASFAQSAADTILRGFVYDPNTKPKHGPGAVSEQYGASKFEFPTWSWRLEQQFPYDIYGLVNHGFLGEPEPDHFRDSVPAKLIDVPKDYKSPRLIASEPICAQFIQQSILKDLRRNVKRSVLRHSIDFLDQRPSQDAAVKGSLDRSISTIDLSSASDRLSCALVECIFRRSYSYLEYLNAARTPDITLPDGTILHCNKFAAQGAAFTFPVQSICYTVLVLGCILADNPRMRLADACRKVRVFGDDIACPSEYFDDAVSLLTSVGLVINQTKSFSRGSFRESCGMDAYAGVDVTPTYVRRLFQRRDPYTTLSVVECSNNLYKKGFFRASSTLLESIPSGLRKKIPWVAYGSSIWGIVGPNTFGSKYRFCQKLQRHEVRVLDVTSRDETLSPDGAERLMDWFINEPGQENPFDPKRYVQRRSKYRERWIPAYSLAGPSF